MSWHPYDRHRRNWAIYWQAPTPEDQATGSDVIHYELTEPYALNRDEWNALQIKVLSGLTPPGHTLNISQLWSRMVPVDGTLRFAKLTDMHNMPVVLSAAADREEQPGKREDYFWIMTQLEPEQKLQSEIVVFQNIDLENITWITAQPIGPWPSQIYLYNEAAVAWNAEKLSSADFDRLVQRECWGMSVTHLSHLYFLTTRERCAPEAVFQILQEAAAEFELEVETTPFDQRPRKPGLLKALGSLPGNLVTDGWDSLKARNKGKLNK